MHVEKVSIGPTQVSLLCDISIGTPRLIVPQSWQKRIFDIIYGLLHPSIVASQKLIATKFVWHGLNRDVGLRALRCIGCQSAKVHTHVKAPLESNPPSHARFDHVNIDIWARCRHRQASGTFLPWLIGLHNGPQQFLSLMPLPIIELEHF